MIRASFIASVLLLAGCAGWPGVSQSAGLESLSPSTVAAASASSPTPSAVADPLFGTWRRTGSFATFVEAMQGAELTSLIGLTDGKWMAGGVTPTGTDPSAKDYCVGATEVEHSHFFRSDGQFGSYDEKGNQVDDGPYELVGNDTIHFGQVVVRYQIDASDHLWFTDVSIPSCTGATYSSGSADPASPGDCSQDHGWAISAFYPGDYERVPS
jgi:hypothetical protein